jgi:MFS superfamily sulfate permease-like transporter
VVTALAIVTVNMLEGVLVGLVVSVAKAAWDASHLRVDHTDEGEGPVRVGLSGTVPFLRLPKILDTLESLPRDRPVVLDLSGLHHLDHACRAALESWADRHRTTGGPASVHLHGPPERRPARPADA